MPMHLVKIDERNLETSSTWFVGQTIEQAVGNIQAKLKSKIKKKSAPSPLGSKYIVASLTELHAEELMATSSTLLENPTQLVKLLQSLEPSLSVRSPASHQELMETMELLQPAKLVAETPEPLELKQTHQSSNKSVKFKLMQLPKSSHTSVSVGLPSSQSRRLSLEKYISRLPATIKLTPVDSNDPMCLQCLSEHDKLYYDYCAGRR